MPESAPIAPRRPGLGEPGRTGPLVLDGDPARDVIEVVEGRCRPDQARAPSHRRNRLRASARDTTRPSEYARSPRAMPSSTARRRRRASYVSTSSGTAAQRPRSVISTGCRVARTSAITSLARRLISVTGVKPGTATCYSGITSAGRRVLAASDSDRLSGQRLGPPPEAFAEKSASLRR